MSEEIKRLKKLLSTPNGRNSVSRMIRLVDLLEMFDALPENEYVWNDDSRLDLLSKEKKVKPDTIVKDLEYLVENKFIEMRPARDCFDQKIRRYACKLLPLTKPCPNCGSRVEIKL